MARRRFKVEPRGGVKLSATEVLLLALTAAVGSVGDHHHAICYSDTVDGLQKHLKIWLEVDASIAAITAPLNR
jgi:hypothetical protein